MTDVYEFAEFDRQNLIYSFSKMGAEEITAAQDRLKKFNEEQAVKKAAVAATAKESPAPTVPAAQVTSPPIKPEPPVTPDNGAV
jgi:formate hydrogenlyase subunit 6/NADH:ubiquinone oxidoreductase subunit I